MTLALKEKNRRRRHARVRAKVSGTALRPRLSIYKSNRAFTAQLINDDAATTLAAVSSASEKGKTPKERVEMAAATVAKSAAGKGIKADVFDRGGFEYTGAVKAFADAARAAGLEF